MSWRDNPDEDCGFTGEKRVTVVKTGDKSWRWSGETDRGYIGAPKKLGDRLKNARSDKERVEKKASALQKTAKQKQTGERVD